jgi:hypothetical protein
MGLFITDKSLSHTVYFKKCFGPSKEFQLTSNVLSILEYCIRRQIKSETLTSGHVGQHQWTSVINQSELAVASYWL